MSFWKSIKNFLGGNNPLKTIGDQVDRFVQTKEEKAEFKMLIQQAAHKQEMALQEIAFRQDQEFNQRIKDLEGTSSDLRQAGIFGRFVLFLRGLQRPLWGYGVLALDFYVFSGRWHVPQGSQLESILWVVNFLVLGFLFGERAVQNVAPLIKEIIAKKK